MEKVLGSGKGIALDIKIGGNDQKGFKLFKQQVDLLMPKDSLVTYSGGTFSFLDEIESSPQKLVVFNVDESNIEDYFQRAENWIRGGVVGRGATVEIGNNVTDEILSFNSSKGVDFPINVWTINRPKDALSVIKKGGRIIITTNNVTLINQICYST